MKDQLSDDSNLQADQLPDDSNLQADKLSDDSNDEAANETIQHDSFRVEDQAVADKSILRLPSTSFEFKGDTSFAYKSATVPNNLFDDTQDTEAVNLANISRLDDSDDTSSDDDGGGLEWKATAPEVIYSSDDENDSITFDTEDPKIYEGAPLSVSESMTAILTYVIKHELDGSEIVDLLGLINLHCKEENNNVKTSLYLFKKYFSILKSPVIYHYFCSSCLTELKKGNNLQCPNLKLHPKKSDISYFIEVPIISQLQGFFSQEEFCLNLSYRYDRKKLNEENIEDIFDGQLYKELVEDGFISKNNLLNFTMMVNADGVPVFKSSKKSLWPVFFNVMELPPHLRFKKEFTIMGGLWFGGKPMVNIILGKLVPSLQKIKQGFEVKPYGKNVTSIAKGILLAATSDLPAKAMLMGMMTHSGSNSCHICKIKGESVKIVKKKVKKKSQKKKTPNQAVEQEENTADMDLELVKEKDDVTYSSVWVFKYEKDRELRSHEESIKLGEAAQKQLVEKGDLSLHVLGFKHPSALFSVMYDAIRGFGIDDLHTLYLGIIKTLIKLWFDSKNHGEPFSIRKYLEVVDERLEAIHPPNFLERGIRGIEDEFSYWNGNECKTWAHYTSIPVLNGILPDKYLEHYVDLIFCFQILLSSSISPQQLFLCQKKLEDFVKKFEILYGTRHTSMVVHLLLHLDFVVTNLGPMKFYSCFPYESLNGEILKMIHGTRYVETQLASGCYLISQLPHKLSSLSSGPVRDYCFRVLHPSFRLKKLEDLSSESQETLFSVGTYKIFNNTGNYVFSALQKVMDLNKATSIETYLRLKKSRQLFVCRSYSRCLKTISYVCSYARDNCTLYGDIDIFVKVKSSDQSCKHFAIIEKAEASPFLVSSKNVPHIKEYCLTGLFDAVHISSLRDILFLVKVDDIPYICEPLL
ncbi:hypothetical protein FOCC_FOCC012910 [Frankliniella occidentalis]|nr:hypothetical protein FOCC_FOCC012910 [Frankliniella occidentalis]